jgi:hypothetical protein
MAKDKMCKTGKQAKEEVFVCGNCSRKAKKEKHLCKPLKIELNK